MSSASDTLAPGENPASATAHDHQPETLRSRFPQLATEWHPTLNEGLTPDGVRPASGRKVWWQCLRDPSHPAWQAAVSQRSTRGRGCPACAGRVATAAENLAARYPAVAAQWHPTLNGELTPDQVRPRSNREVWWRCLNDPSHPAWKAPVARRTRSERSGCVICDREETRTRDVSGRIHPSLAQSHPDIARLWHPPKNRELDPNLSPERLSARASVKVWWQCDRDASHLWQRQVRTMTQSNSSCPICSGRVPSSGNSLAARFPAIAASWHPTLNGDLTPEEVSPHSMRRLWWRCLVVADHPPWQTRVATRSDGSGCPTCAGRKNQPPSNASRNRSRGRDAPGVDAG